VFLVRVTPMQTCTTSGASEVTILRALLVYPQFPITFWGFQYGLQIVGKQANLPPLGLMTVAAILPQEWEYRLVDLNVEPLQEADLAWADVVLTGGMRVQIPSTDDILNRANSAGVRTVVGGPAISTDDALFRQADVRIRGEVEDMAEAMVKAIAGAECGVTLNATGYPKMTVSPVPRFDLANLDAYGAMSIQYSRGCPFQCEFCDIIQLYGRKPRVKDADQILAEMNRLHALGHRGSIFFVDDNFIGNQRAVKELLPALVQYQKEMAYPFNLSTEASINLAGRPALLGGMVEAGFNAVFVGIETPSLEALKAAKKTQNLNMGLNDAIRSISSAGIEVMGGFIVGFDSDTPDIFDAQRALILDSPISIAMVGLLMALPETDLWRRLDRERRLRASGAGHIGDQFGRPNFVPTMDEATLLRGYGELLRSLYTADAYYDRVEAFLDLCEPGGPGGRKARLDELLVLGRILFRIGVVSPRRWRFWRLLRHVVRDRPRKFAWAMSRAIIGEHMIRYTEENVLPLIDESVQAVNEERLAS
jgi:radical SAM superfamily enzyme YgiQ (UPF0313 family)